MSNNCLPNLRIGRAIHFSLSALLFVTFVSNALAVPPRQEYGDDRKRAFQLYREAKYVEALPVFEKLASANPWDREVIEILGFLILGQAVESKDAFTRKQARQRGRELLVRAQQMGANDALLKSTIANIPADGGDDISFSVRKEADDAVREGEAAFIKRQYSKAIESYQLALLFDPKLYAAALFTGDAYYQLGQSAQAGEWYAKAIEIDPDRETAYRYWGDVLMKEGKKLDARDKLIEAYIVEPYNRLSRDAFSNWGERNNLTLSHPNIQIPTSMSHADSGDTTISIDPRILNENKDSALAAWMMYGLVRASWVKSDFSKEFPEERVYRHSLKEEAAALRAVVHALPKKSDKHSKNLDPSLQTLVKLDQEGLLEAYILLAIPDEGIARDFADYRRANAGKLRRYVLEYVIAPKN
jgi:tetratricopeptide (TPR) repeat protein